MRRQMFKIVIGLLIIGAAPLSALAQQTQEDEYETLGLPRYGASTAVLNRLGASSWDELAQQAFNDRAQYLISRRTQNPSQGPELDILFNKYKAALDAVTIHKADTDRKKISDVIKKGGTFYDILNVTKTAKPNELDYAYALMAQTLRSQPNDKLGEAAPLLVEVTKAYATLKDTNQKAFYDSTLTKTYKDPNYEQLLLTEGQIPPRLLLRIKEKALDMKDKAYIKTKIFADARLMEAGGNLGFVGGALIQLCGKALLSGDPAMIKVCSDDQFDLNSLLSIYAFSVGANFGTPLIRASGLRPRYAGHMGMPFGSVTNHYYDKFFTSKEQKIFWDNFKEWKYEAWAKAITLRDLKLKELQSGIYKYTQSGYDKNPNSPEAIKAQADLENLRQDYWNKDKEIEPFRNEWHKNLAKAMYETIHTDWDEFKDMGKSMARMFATVATIDLFKTGWNAAEAKFLLTHQDQIKASLPAEKAGQLIDLQRQIDEAKRTIEQYPELKSYYATLDNTVANNLAGKQLRTEYEAAKDFILGNFKKGSQPADIYEREILLDGALDIVGKKVMNLPQKYLPENIAIPLDEWLMQPAAKVASIPGKIKRYFTLEDIDESSLTFALKTRLKVGQFGANLIGGAQGAIPFLTIDQIYNRGSTQVITATELENQIKAPLMNLDDGSQKFVSNSDADVGIVTYVKALEEYNKVWGEYRTKVIMAQFNEHYIYYQKLEEKATSDVEKKINYILWLKAGAHEDDKDFIANGKDSVEPTPPWHSDPHFRETFEREKAYYRSLITNWDDKPLENKLNAWRSTAATKWDDLNSEAVAYLGPIMQNTYFNAKSIPLFRVGSLPVASNFINEGRNTWEFARDLFNDLGALLSYEIYGAPIFIKSATASRIPLPLNLEDSYLEQLNILETYCSQVVSHLPPTVVTINLGVLCSKGAAGAPEFITFIKDPSVANNPALEALKTGKIKSLTDPKVKGDLVSILMAANLADTVGEISTLKTNYDNFTGVKAEEHLPTPAEQDQRTKKVLSEIMDSKKQSCQTILKTGAW